MLPRSSRNLTALCKCKLKCIHSNSLWAELSLFVFVGFLKYLNFKKYILFHFKDSHTWHNTCECLHFSPTRSDVMTDDVHSVKLSVLLCYFNWNEESCCGPHCGQQPPSLTFLHPSNAPKILRCCSFTLLYKIFPGDLGIKLANYYWKSILHL